MIRRPQIPIAVEDDSPQSLRRRAREANRSRPHCWLLADGGGERRDAAAYHARGLWSLVRPSGGTRIKAIDVLNVFRRRSAHDTIVADLTRAEHVPSDTFAASSRPRRCSSD